MYKSERKKETACLLENINVHKNKTHVYKLNIVFLF